MSKLSDALAAMDKATAGPWWACCSNPKAHSHYVFSVPQEDASICRMYQNDPNDCKEYAYCSLEGIVTHEQRQANAAVIAAAPDALTWIKEALPWLEEMRLHVSLDPAHYDHELARLDALIAQANPEEVGK